MALTVNVIKDVQLFKLLHDHFRCASYVSLLYMRKVPRLFVNFTKSTRSSDSSNELMIVRVKMLKVRPRDN